VTEFDAPGRRLPRRIAGTVPAVEPRLAVFNCTFAAVPVPVFVTVTTA
jgi:hypothetical protein